jgi:hypothetical protein
VQTLARQFNLVKEKNGILQKITSILNFSWLSKVWN